jgi:hypothetical protein
MLINDKTSGDLISQLLILNPLFEPQLRFEGTSRIYRPLTDQYRPIYRIGYSKGRLFIDLSDTGSDTEACEAYSRSAVSRV